MEKKVTKEEAEARALELYPNTHIATVNQLHEVSREAYLQGWEDMQVAMDAKQAADEVDRDKQKEKINALLVTALRELTDSESLVLIKALQERNPLYDKQTCGFCVEPKEVEMIECPDCNGEGTWYNDTSRQCTTYRGDCCGGCGYDVDCDTCNGTGEIEKEEE